MRYQLKYGAIWLCALGRGNRPTGCVVYLLIRGDMVVRAGSGDSAYGLRGLFINSGRYGHARRVGGPGLRFGVYLLIRGDMVVRVGSGDPAYGLRGLFINSGRYGCARRVGGPGLRVSGFIYKIGAIWSCWVWGLRRGSGSYLIRRSGDRSRGRGSCKRPAS